MNGDHENDAKELVAAAIKDAEEMQGAPIGPSQGLKPRLLIENCNPDRTVTALRNILAGAGSLYDRGVPVRLAFDQMQGGTVAQVITPDVLVLMAHTVCRPYVLKEQRDGTVVEVDARLSRTFAVMYLDWRGEWRLRPLNGIALAPLLQEDGTIRSAVGYDQASGMWRENVPQLEMCVPEQPTADDAAAALLLIRKTFRTFCFADAKTIENITLALSRWMLGGLRARTNQHFSPLYLPQYAALASILLPASSCEQRLCPAPAPVRVCLPAASQLSHSDASHTPSRAARMWRNWRSVLPPS
jgi:hypothetical protein